MTSDERLDLLPDRNWEKYTVQEMQDKISRELEYLNATWEMPGSSGPLTPRLGKLREQFVQISQVMAMNSLWLDKLVEMVEMKKKDVEECEQAATDFSGFVDDLKRIEQANHTFKTEVYEHLKENAKQGSTTQTGGSKALGGLRNPVKTRNSVKRSRKRSLTKSRRRSLKSSRSLKMPPRSKGLERASVLS
jgi:hypothetical protein